MESMDPREAAVSLADAEASRTRLANDLVLPRYFYVSIGAAIAVQIVTTAVGLAVQRAWAGWLMGAGLVAFALVAGFQLTRFRRHNGVRVGGFASRVVFGTSNAASGAYALAAGAAVWSAFEGVWWLVAIAGLVGGAAYAWSGQRWLRTYRADPAAYGRGEPVWWLVAAGVVAVAGVATLALNS